MSDDFTIPPPEGVTPEMEDRARQMTKEAFEEWDNILTELEACVRLGVMVQGSRYFTASHASGTTNVAAKLFAETGRVTERMSNLMASATLLVSQQLESEISWLETTAKIAEQLSKRCRTAIQMLHPLRDPSSLINHLKTTEPPTVQ